MKIVKIFEDNLRLSKLNKKNIYVCILFNKILLDFMAYSLVYFLKLIFNIIIRENSQDFWRIQGIILVQDEPRQDRLINDSNGYLHSHEDATQIQILDSRRKKKKKKSDSSWNFTRENTKAGIFT